MTDNIEILKANIDDLKRIREIYAYYVENTCACFDETVPNEEYFLNLFEELNNKGLPFYIAKIDDKVVGYCYANNYRKRSAYRYSVETSIYIDHNFTGKGIARKVFAEVLREVKEQGYKQMIAVIVDQGSGYSDKFHKDMGFEEKGKLSKVGFKFNKWLDIYLMQKEL